MTEADRKQIADLCLRIINAEQFEPSETIALVRQLNDLLDSLKRITPAKPPATPCP
ncbi:MAG: hypothetical protein WAN70_01190 [Terriglobales bacterium]